MIIGFITQLLQFDKELFFAVNQGSANGFFDVLMPLLRYPKTWIPLYALLFLYAALKFKWKSWTWVLAAVVCITISDQLSSQVLKGFFDRLRPCQDFPELVRLLVDRCPGNASFPSSHAVNHFAIGSFFMITLQPYIKKNSYLFLLWAASICFAQVYVGVHYPLDVTAGAVLGLALGLTIALIYNKYFRFGSGGLFQNTKKLEQSGNT